MDTQAEFKKLLEDALRELGGTLSASVDDVAKYMSERAKNLSESVGEPGFDQAVRAARNNVAMKAGLKLDDEATAWDARLFGIIQGALRIAAGALA